MFIGAGTRKGVGLFILVLVLTACNTADDASKAPTTGQRASFHLSGDVGAVDVEDVDVDVDVSAGPGGINIDPSAGVTVQLTVTLESINQEAGRLCGLQSGGEAVVVVTDETDLELDRPLSELGTIQDESITASGTAEQLAAATADAAEPGTRCSLTASTLAVAEEPGGGPTATTSASP